ncbi:family 20 glycosylhydrolase [Collinsella sp. zg1085]|uniref:family 20 glycosylhydrolase n=1 Tax=Collinsella sp. zg1085 TaxID=2844380 RepID=UPI001C0CBF83|nr:family 20 glycosylhydrolase [Collinsella sp. zg1085]QWT17764.1 family 20 glycosylhydrolase [Collinsella sp. zg1085]
MRHRTIRQSFWRAIVALVGLVLLSLPLAVQGAQAAEATQNLALTGSVTSSGRELDDKWGPELAIDGNIGGDRTFREVGANFRSPDASRWSANKADEVWLAVDLGARAKIDDVTVTWGKQYGTNYTIETSDDGVHWTAAAPAVTQTSPSEQVKTELSGAVARHVRVHVTARNSVWSVGIWEVEVHGVWAGKPPMKESDLPAVVPTPVRYAPVEGEDFTLDPAAEIIATGDAVAEAEKFATTLRRSTGYKLPVVAASTDDVADITFALTDADPLSEAYAIRVMNTGIQLTAHSVHGLFNGAQTMYQLFGPFSVAAFTTNGPWTVPALSIDDAPRFSYRGIMLDPARSLFTVDEIKQSIDVMAMYKLSYLHLHLVDDQGWRIEITNEGRVEGDTIDYTRLTEISSKTAMGTTERQAIPGVPGYYTQDDLREIVAYAAAHHIEVVPEIDMPGHSQAILHAIPELNSAGSSHNGTVDPDTGALITDPAHYITAPNQSSGNVGNSYLDPTSENTWTFLNHVVDQVSKITGSKFFHMGGDETHAMNQKLPGAAGRFLTKAGEMLRGKGLLPIGWNEWAQGGGEIKENDTIQYWTGQKAPTTNVVSSKAAKVIFSGAAQAYFPQKAGASIWGATWAGNANLSGFYDYDPVAMMGVSEDALRGVEGAMWNEHVRSIQDFFMPSYPRAMALAEVGWSPQARRTGKLADLKRRLAATVPALTLHGADFYAEDGLVNRAIIAGTNLTATVGDEGGHTIAYAYLPMTAADAVTAKLTWDNGSATELVIKQTRPYQAPNPNNNNNRAQNGIWELVLAHLPEEGTHSGTVTFSVGDQTVSDTVTCTVRAKPAPTLINLAAAKFSAPPVLEVAAVDAEHPAMFDPAKVTVTLPSGAALRSAAADAGTVLEYGKDYTLEYEGNTDEGPATVLARGMGAYTGTTSAHEFMVRVASAAGSDSSTSSETGNPAAPDTGNSSVPDAGSSITTDSGTPAAPDTGSSTTPDSGTSVAPDAGNSTAPSDTTTVPGSDNPTVSEGSTASEAAGTHDPAVHVENTSPNTPASTDLAGAKDSGGKVDKHSNPTNKLNKPKANRVMLPKTGDSVTALMTVVLMLAVVSLGAANLLGRPRRD